MKVYNGSSWDLVAPDTSNFIDKSILTAKGSLISASGASTPSVLTVASTNGYILAVDSATTTGLAWVAANPGDITAVTAGTGLSGGGTSGDVTLSIDTTVTVDLNTAQTLTNKTISGSSNTLSNINNSSLTSSSITVNGSSVSLGGSVTIAGGADEVAVLMGVLL
jgi:20S proteasome alpha/beta subunit